MAAMRGSRLPVGSAAWINEERTSALQIAESEVEEFAFSARNDFEWLNEHMTEIFNENEINVAEIFKTPGKLRGKTPRTIRKTNPGEARVPLSDLFSSTPKGTPNPFAQQLNRLATPKLKVAAEPNTGNVSVKTSPQRPQPASKRPNQQPNVSVIDSGYHGSQSQESMDIDDDDNQTKPAKLASPQRSPHRSPDHVAFHANTLNAPQSPTRTKNITSPERTFHTAREDQTTRVMPDMTQRVMAPIVEAPPSSPVRHAATAGLAAAPAQSSSPLKSSPMRFPPVEQKALHKEPPVVDQTVNIPEMDDADDLRSPSDGSSPIRPVVRKSSLNFASLPARDPVPAKSIGARVSRTSHLDYNRTSYYPRHTGGKSLGGNIGRVLDDDDMDVDDATVQAPRQERQDTTENLAVNHNKTYTQRLQDQISMLGKSQGNAPRPSKSVANLPAPQAAASTSSQQHAAPEPKLSRPESPKRKPVPSPAAPASTTPGAFPEEDDDDWIEPPTAANTGKNIFSPRPAIAKSHTADVMQGIHGKSTVGGSEFVLPKQRQPDSRPVSPARGQAPSIPERTTSTLGHYKSASVSVPVLPNFGLGPSQDDYYSPKKAISVSNPTLSTVAELDRPDTPSKSPSRTLRESPLKQVKNKLSSILKSSKGLLASSAAISAEGKSSLLSPSTTRLGHYGGPSTDSVFQPSLAEQLYPDLSKQATGSDTQTLSSTASPPRPGRRTRASVEREKEAKRKDKEVKLMNDQMDKLKKAREREDEKARVFSQEQERVVAMEKHVAAQREPERPQTSPQKAPVKPTRTSPRKAKAQEEAEAKAAAAAVATPAARRVADDDLEMGDAPATMRPPPVPRSAGPGTAPRTREIKRPLKPTKDTVSKPRAAPTVIRVNTGSQHSQFHPSNSVLAANLQDTLGAPIPQNQLSSKASQASLKTKASMQSLKSSTSSSGRPKALELAAKRKEQEEREAQRKREAKAELERKRAAQQEEERRQDQQRRLEAEKQKEKEREQAAVAAEAKKAAQRQAAIEKAKQTRAPPPAVRSQAGGQADFGFSGDASQAGPARPPSRLTSTMRSQEELGRPANAPVNAAKPPLKRTVTQDGHDDASARNAQTRNGPTYQAKDAKRRRTSEGPNDDAADSRQSSIKGPPVRPSAGFKKDLPAKAMFPNGYTTAPPSAARDLFKATVTSQHNNHAKAAHPLDMAQVSKAAIPFAPNPNAASTAAAGATHKTPARPAGAAGAKSAAKSAQRSSPRFQNGDAIELPEIQTDEEDSDSDDGGAAGSNIAAWADSPDLRRALVRQETMDPSHIFGPPAPLVMEEVFSKSKDRWHKFRARTSSANWSGSDRLTEDDIRKDMAARDRMRREGGWSYEMSREML